MNKNVKLSLVALLAVSAVSLNAGATGVIVQGATGHPYQSTNWSGYTIGDGSVTVGQSKAFVVPIPLDPTVSKTYTVAPSFTYMQEATVFTFYSGGGLAGIYGVSIINGTPAAYPSVPVTSFLTMFLRVTASSTHNGIINSVSAY